MSGIQRFLSKREKHGHGKHHSRNPRDKTTTTVHDSHSSSIPDKFHGFFSADSPAEPDEQPKIRDIRKRIALQGVPGITEAPILFALRSRYAGGEVDKAFELLMLAEESWEGLLKDYNPTIKLLGSENRQGVTCYLDALLFAMFSRLSSFEAILYNTFDDEPRKKLSMLLRLWVNMLRSGKLITTDITKMIQGAIAECGWEEAAEMCQHDSSEAFTFITSTLELPLLTLKMDIFHTGKEEANDDHKFINERLLEVAIPPEAVAGGQSVTLEECLETYFNNRIEVRRYLARRSTMNSTRSFDSTSKGATAAHVETVEVDPAQASPYDMVGDPLSASGSQSPLSPVTPQRAPLRHRAPSIVQERFIPEDGEPEGFAPKDTLTLKDTEVKDSSGRKRRGSIRKEVMMPAWQFFSLIPWYTDNAPTDDAQVATHFSSKRPILGMCLKRYSYLPSGRAIRLNTHVDIPIEIGLPHFIKDDHLGDNAPLYGNFKLSLQSVVCHRGTSVDSGHYIALVRGTAPNPGFAAGDVRTTPEDPKHWMRFDDLASERITLIDIEKAMKEESPYLLFYQILPVEGDPDNITGGEEKPASLAESEGKDSGVAGVSLSSLTLASSVDEAVTSARPSLEITGPDNSRGRLPALDEPHHNVTFSEGTKQNGGLAVTTNDGASGAATPRNGSNIGRNNSHHRSSSRTSQMMSDAISSLTGRASRERLPLDGAGDPTVVVKEVTSLDTKGKAVLRKDAKRDKSKQRQDRSSAGVPRGRAEKPDRECVVM